MPSKPPLVLDGNELSLVLAGDYLEPSSLGTGTPGAATVLRGDSSWAPLDSGGLTIQQVTLDFGTFPVNAKTFTVTGLSDVAVGDQVVVVPSGYVPAGAYFDDAEFEAIVYVAACEVANTLKVVANSSSRVMGLRNVYLLFVRATTFTTTTIERIRYVAASGGNDGTAAVGDISSPYATIRAAVDACVAGDIVCLLPGAHTGSNPPYVLKNGCTLTSLMGRGATSIEFPGAFPMQLSTATTTMEHGGHIQPSLGVSGVDACFVSGLTINLGMDSNSTYAMITGINTAAGTAVVGTGAEYSDMYVDDCVLNGVSDVHVIIDAIQRTYFRNCTLSSSYDICHLIGPNNTAHMIISDSRLIFHPRYDLVNYIGAPLSGFSRVRSGTLTLNDCVMEIYNDGTTDWSGSGYSLADTEHVGMIVDDKVGAAIIINGGLPVRTRGPAFPVPVIPRFCSTNAANTQSRGAVVVEGGVPGLCDYNLSSSNPVPPRIVPRSGLTLKATVFAAAAVSATKNNTYRCTGAVTVKSFLMFTLPPGCAIKGVWIDRKTAFSGGAGSATTIEVGVVGGVTDKFLVATNIRTTGIVASAALHSIEAAGDPLADTGIMIGVTVRNTGANISTLTAGEVTVHIELSGVAVSEPI